jgi:hypothetical protein
MVEPSGSHRSTRISGGWNREELLLHAAHAHQAQREQRQRDAMVFQRCSTHQFTTRRKRL